MGLVHSVALRRASGLTAVIGLAMLGLAGLPGTAALAATLAATRAAASASPPPVDRFNVGATHSPELLHALAGPAAPASLAHPAGSAGAAPGVLAAPARLAPDAASAAAVRGVDVASYQHVNGAAINWSKVAAAGYKFTAIKAAEGNYYANPYRASDLSGAEKAKLSVIAYEFAIPNASGGAGQADYVIAHAADESGKVAPIGLDIEYDPYTATDGTNECYGLSRSAMTSWVAAFSNEVRRRTGEFPVLYTTADWWDTCAASTALGQDSLWDAAYTTAASPPLPVGWSTWDIWQYTSAGTVPGILTSGNTDLDEFNARAVPVFSPGNQTTLATVAAAPVKAATLAVAGRAAPSYTATGLPPGLSIGAVTGQITGRPGVAGLYHVKVIVTSAGLTGSASFTWKVNPVYPTSAVGAVALDLGGKCLADGGNSSAIGHPIETWGCNGLGYESWQVTGGTIQIHGRCLAAAGTTSQSKVVLAACAAAAASQQWRVGTGAALVNLGSGACLDDPHSSAASGVALWIYTCNGGASQKWTLPAGPVLSQVAGQCLDNASGTLANGNKVEIWPCNGYGAQAWTVEPGGTVRTHGWCLDVFHSGTAAGSRVDLFSCNGTAAQQWRVLVDGSAVSLRNPKSGQCLSDPADATVSGTGLVLGSCASTGPGTAWLVR
jgi:GH25 family lysozyme M1 (1,4-beta-N-acetylmuramidase)